MISYGNVNFILEVPKVLLWQIFNFSILDYLLGSGIDVKNKGRGGEKWMKLKFLQSLFANFEK